MSETGVILPAALPDENGQYSIYFGLFFEIPVDPETARYIYSKFLILPPLVFAMHPALRQNPEHPAACSR
jgi:hypothetical protein